VGIRCADHATLYPQKLALTSPTSGGRSAGIVRSRAKAREFFPPYLYYFRLKVVEVQVLTHITQNLKAFRFEGEPKM
jgi:hypothetical protein